MPTATPTRFRKLPVEVDAMQWTGGNEPDIIAFAGASNFYALPPEDRVDDPEATAVVFDEKHSSWIGVYTGHWVVRGLDGEFYPITGEMLARTYEPVDVADELLRRSEEDGAITRMLEAESGRGDDAGV